MVKTAAVVTTDQDLRKQLDELDAETATARTNREAYTAKLAELETEYTRALSSVARGELEEVYTDKLKVEIDRLSARIDGCKLVEAQNEPRLTELNVEVGRRQGEVVRQARLAQAAELKRQGLEAARKLRADLTRLITQDLRALDDTRLQLAKEYADLGGAQAARQIAAELQDRDRENHIRQLSGQGWIEDYRLQAANAGWPMKLSVRSMMPTRR